MAESGESGALARIGLVAEGALKGAGIISMSGSEGIDQPFLLQVECLADSSMLSMEEAIGQHMTITLRYGATERLLDGMCAAIRHLPHGIGMARYVLELRPWFWWLTLSADNRIFQAKSISAIR
jgi:type VI secretion system secreted protein VgrG